MPKHRLLLPLFVLVAALALAACGGSSESDEDKIVDVIETSATTSDPADCEALTTLAFMEQTEKETGKAAIKSCEEGAEDTADDPDEVTVSEVAVDGSNATADAAFVGGSLDGQTITVALIEEDGDWKLDQLESFVVFDQQALVDAFREGFEESGELEAEQLSCIVGEFEAASEGELEELVLDGSLESLIELVQACE